jgi:hypothetical protein
MYLHSAKHEFANRTPELIDHEAAQAQLTEVVREYDDCCNDLERERIAGRETRKQAMDWQSRFLG